MLVPGRAVLCPDARNPLPDQLGNPLPVNDRFGQVFWGLVATAAGLFAAALVVGGALGRVRQGADQIEVTGSARQPARADLSVWRPSLTTVQPSLRSAYQDIQRQGTRVRNYLRAAGVADSVIEAAPAAVDAVEETVDGRLTGRTLGYRATQAFPVRSRAHAIARGAGARVGGLRAVRTGVIQVVPRYSTEVSDDGINDVSAIDKDVMAVVRATFAVR